MDSTTARHAFLQTPTRVFTSIFKSLNDLFSCREKCEFIGKSHQYADLFTIIVTKLIHLFIILTRLF